MKEDMGSSSAKPTGAAKSSGEGSAEVRKVVVNRCHGGFGLSDEGYRAYAARKGLTLYPAPIEPGHSLVTYWTVPPSKRPKELLGAAWQRASPEERAAANAAYDAAMIYDKDIPRDDPDLVAVVEELGEHANGRFARLDVAEIPADVKWHIEEYDGSEHVAEDHRTW